MQMTVLEQKRRANKWSRAELARKAKMQGSMIGWIEEGRFKPYDSQLAKLAAALDVDEPKKLIDMVEA